MTATATIRSLISFLTTIPAGMPDDAINRTADKMYLFPVVGAFIGVLVGMPSLIFFLYLPKDLASILSYGVLTVVTGLQHLDGLLDFGDGMMTHNTPERKIEAMKDPRIGVGGIFTGVFFAILTITLISKLSITTVLPSFVVCEVTSKLSMVFLAWLGEPASTGMGSLFIRKMRGETNRFLTSLGFTTLAAWIALGWKGIGSVVASLLGSLLLLKIANRNFKGLTGDVLGASNEISRTVVLLLIVGVTS